ncbi:MAG: hypothetical protein QM534_08165 [Sediminibacterium sp.]|nr:hypothetical protein [Sediminibacterium sp.]
MQSVEYGKLINTFKENDSKIDFININSSNLEVNLQKIESILLKELPRELVEFYSFCDGLEFIYRKGGSSYEVIPGLSEMFDDYKTHSQDITPDDIENGNVYDEPFFETLWDETTIENEIYNIDEPEGKVNFKIIRRQKLLCTINGTGHNLTIDFFDKNKDYQIYFQYEGNLNLYPLSLSIAKFYLIVLQIGFTGFWIAEFMSKEGKEDLNLSADINKIKEEYPDFDLLILK